MRIYGSKRTYGNCLTCRHRGGKIHVIVRVKSHAAARKRARRLAHIAAQAD